MFTYLILSVNSMESRCYEKETYEKVKPFVQCYRIAGGRVGNFFLKIF